MSGERIVHIVDGVAIIPDDGQSYKLAIACENCGSDITYAVTMTGDAFTKGGGGTWGCRSCGHTNGVPPFVAGSRERIEAFVRWRRSPNPSPRASRPTGERGHEPDE